MLILMYGEPLLLMNWTIRLHGEKIVLAGRKNMVCVPSMNNILSGLIN